MHARNGRARLYYEVRGNEQGPPLLLIRGLIRNLHHWGEFADQLEDQFCLILFDNRGVGRSNTPPPPYSTAQMADDAIAVLSAAGFERAHVMGMSLGGMIAQQVALRHPERVNRLILGCTRGHRRAGPPMRMSVVYEMLSSARLEPDEAVRSSAPLALSPHFVEQNPQVIDRWVELARQYPPTRAAFLGQVAAAARHDTRGKLRRVQHPTLVVTGDADRLIHPRCSELLARELPNAELRLLFGAAHDFTTEIPQQSSELVAEFLGRG